VQSLQALRVEVKFFDCGSSSSSVSGMEMSVSGVILAAVQFAKPSQASGLARVAGQRVSFSSGAWMSVFSIATDLFAIGMPIYRRRRKEVKTPINTTVSEIRRHKCNALVSAEPTFA
jgi:hypothetical protein